jgi:uncharacterized protein YvpB
MSKDDSIHLNVPAYRQTKNYTCVPSCCKMILDYMNQVKLTKPESDRDETEIAKIMKTTISGTHFRNIVNINKMMTSSNPSLEFVIEFGPHTLSDIRKELESGLPVSVWIITNDGSNDYVHSIVITGMDEIKKEISYNDPTYGREQTISQIEFMSLWESHGARMIKTKIGGINRDTLEKYMPSGVQQ